jgi:hypothetical protein
MLDVFGADAAGDQQNRAVAHQHGRADRLSTGPPTARVYRYSAANLVAIVHEPDQVVTVNGFTAVFLACSITLVVVPSGVPLIPRVYLPVVLRGY